MEPGVPSLRWRRANSPRHEERPVQRDVDHRSPRIGRHVLGGHREVGGRVVDQHIGQAERRGGLVEGGGDLLGIPDVTRHDFNGSRDGLNGGPGGVEMFRLAARHHQIGPEPGELDRDGSAQTGPATGDQNGLALVRAGRQGTGALLRRLGQTQQVRHAQLPV